jgi:multidrug efflux pump subunit AcrA (membrane-fusion protein)
MHRFFAFLALVLFASAPPLRAHEGHDHDAAPLVEPAGSMQPRLAGSGTIFEIVAVADGDVLTIYLDRRDSTEPVSGATIEITREDASALLAEAAGPGTYMAEAPWLAEPGAKPLVFTVTAGEEADLLNGVLTVPRPEAVPDEAVHGWLKTVFDARAVILAGAGAALGLFLGLWLGGRRAPLTVILLTTGLLFALPPPSLAHEGHVHSADEAAPPVTGNSPRREPGGDVFLPKVTQRLIELRTERARVEQAPLTYEVIGTVIADPSAFGRVQAPMDGQVELGDTGIPYVGQRVEAGQVLARVTPTIPLADLGTMQQLRAEVAGKLVVAEQKLRRLSSIASVVAQSDIEDTRAELEALREQRRVLEAKDVQKFDLVAPVAGVIALADVRAGQVVTARDTLFEIIDPARLWVEAAGTDTHSEDDVVGGIARDADGHALKLDYIGRSPALRQQSQSLLFRLTEPHTGLAVGAPVSVVVQRRATDTGLILPEGAVVRASNGLPQVWIKTAPERFRPAHVTVRPLDGARVLVTKGLVEGERVVTRGAELVNQIR